MMCRPCDLISLTFWGKSCLSHMGHASSNCTIHLLRHGSMLHPKGVFVIMVGDNWDNTYTYIYIYTLWTLISLICTDMKMYMVYMLGSNLHHFPMWKILCLFPRLIHPLLTWQYYPWSYYTMLPKCFGWKKMHVCSVYFRWPGTQDIASLWGWLKVVEPSSPLSRCSCRRFRKQLVSHQNSN